MKLDGPTARTYFMFYVALVGAAYIQSRGAERKHALKRAWSYYACPLVDCLWDDEPNPAAELVAHELMGWLWSLKALKDPEAAFRELYEEEKKRQVTTALARKGATHY